MVSLAWLYKGSTDVIPSKIDVSHVILEESRVIGTTKDLREGYKNINNLYFRDTKRQFRRSLNFAYTPQKLLLVILYILAKVIIPVRNYCD